jgi:hypothetical protein
MPGISHRATDLDLATARSYPHSPDLFDQGHCPKPV